MKRRYHENHIFLHKPPRPGIIVPGAQVLQAGGDVCGFAVVQVQVGIEAVRVHLAAEQTALSYTFMLVPSQKRNVCWLRARWHKATQPLGPCPAKPGDALYFPEMNWNLSFKLYPLFPLKHS